MLCEKFRLLILCILGIFLPGHADLDISPPPNVFENWTEITEQKKTYVRILQFLSSKLFSFSIPMRLFPNSRNQSNVQRFPGSGLVYPVEGSHTPSPLRSIIGLQHPLHVGISPSLACWVNKRELSRHSCIRCIVCDGPLSGASCPNVVHRGHYVDRKGHWTGGLGDWVCDRCAGAGDSKKNCKIQ